MAACERAFYPETMERKVALFSTVLAQRFDGAFLK
jgi:hypothetical protein